MSAGLGWEWEPPHLTHCLKTLSEKPRNAEKNPNRCLSSPSSPGRAVFYTGPSCQGTGRSENSIFLVLLEIPLFHRMCWGKATLLRGKPQWEAPITGAYCPAPSKALLCLDLNNKKKAAFVVFVSFLSSAGLETVC